MADRANGATRGAGGSEKIRGTLKIDTMTADLIALNRRVEVVRNK